MSDAVGKAVEAIGACKVRPLAELFADDPARVSKLAARIEWADGDETRGVLFDWSKTHLDDDLLIAFEALAEARDFAGKRAALFAGEKVNPTEGRAAEHTAQRGSAARRRSRKRPRCTTGWRCWSRRSTAARWAKCAT